MFVFCSNNSFLPCFLFIYPAGTRSHNLSVAEEEHNSSSFSIPTQFCLSSSDFISSLTFNGKVWSAIIKPSLLSNSFSCTGLEIFWLQNVIWTPNPILCPNIFIFRNQANANQFSKHRHFLAKFQTLSFIHLIPLQSKTSSQNTVFHEFYRRFRSGFEKSQISWKSKPLMNSGYFMYLQSYQGLWEAGADRNQYRYYCHEQGKWIRIKRSHYSLGFQLLIVMHSDDIFLYADRWRFQPEGM